MSDIISNRYDFVFLFDVTNGNPNGDPDAGNSPRLDPETGHGLVSDVCIKRKIRNYVSLTKNPSGLETDSGYDIYVKEKAILNNQHTRAYKALEKDGAKIEKNGKSVPGFEEKACAWMCQTFFDVRMFGAVMSTGVNAGQVRGPVQIAFSRSVDPIISLEQSITRMAVTTKEESEKQDGGNRTMGRKEIIPYGLYRCHGFVNANLAARTGFNVEDLKLLWDSIISLFEHDRSASRGEMASQKLFVFEHASTLGNFPAHKLFQRVQFEKKDKSKPARSFVDYQQRDAASLKDLPEGITLHEMLSPQMPEQDLLPISALQHLLFCPRQCALIHVERLWAENSLTREGRHLHEKADAGKGESRKRPAGAVRIARGLMLRSLELGLFGKADVVEFRSAGVAFPIEYKRGKPKKNRCDEVQLCAQALCLEELLATAVPAGALFYGITRRRTEVAFDRSLRALTLNLIRQLREMVETRATPSAVREKKCDKCSLLHLCLPEAKPGTDGASRYLRRALGQALTGTPVGE